MIDIHCHILPGVDDGAQSLEDSLMMAELACESGVQAIIATCHSNQEAYFENYESPELRDVFRELKRALEAEKLPLILFRGMEIFSSDDMVGKLKQGRLLTLNQSSYALVEFDFSEEPWKMESAFEDLLEYGIIPVIAHPERYHCIQDEPNLLYEWMQMGCLSQMNKGSIFGKFGKKAAKTADMMLQHKLVSCIASDAHSPYARTPYMGDIQKYLSEQFSMEYMNLLLRKNPLRILENKSVETRDCIPVARKKRWF